MTPRELLGEGTLLRTDPAGDVPDTGTYGLFLDDTRHLSHWELTVDGTRPRLLTGDGDELVLTPWTRRGADPSCTVFRRQTVRYGRLTERDRLGWLVYRTDGAGLVHQCWKDSARGICFRSGEPAGGRLAVAEVQAYAYAALRGTAGIARRVWGDHAYADRLDRTATDLRARFVREFWLDRDDFVALALTEDGRQVDALASNAGHVLWTGLLDDDRATRVGRRLAGPDFFSGWGIRTVAAGQPAYHPVSYHTGGVWPHDTAIVVAGLARHGLHAEAETIARGLLAAAAHQRYRLPEVFAGFGRDEHPVPVPYPHSCSIQAWAAAAPLLLRRTLHTTQPEDPTPTA
ncbi:MGH1-like glycoside hydrolase domain-containing protein [Micromonospora inyonensis]|uniref:Amylo-alpha-1,6-glucosidase n=1 Tax=Micromonospora inyonensis TaxID=47866 RepID=A0A1C6SEI4_9ACTN|nr:glycogen debranching N-terminal domain-containing protein [Micromonospora inyonensis]SCL27904.1 Amylo-alpha-1,6-glucosidase [Micromonospora inyonensis]